MRDPVAMHPADVAALVKKELERLTEEQRKARARLEVSSVSYYELLVRRLSSVRNEQDWKDYLARDRC